MVEVLLSVRPNWMKLILERIKYIELRKSAPQQKSLGMFRVYLYETKSESGRGAVVGECICYLTAKAGPKEYINLTAGSCLTELEIKKYAGAGTLWPWYLAQVKEYEKPQPLSNFGVGRAPQSWQYLKKLEEQA